MDSHAFIGHSISYSSNVQPELNGAKSSQGRAYPTRDNQTLDFSVFYPFYLWIYLGVGVEGISF